MSGHSKWHTIKHKKGAADAKRGKIFTRIIKELTVAARNGGADPDSNPRLRTIIAEARSVNMPQDNIKRAIRRGTGEEEGVSYDEITYEAYGPGGVAIMIETLTDNKNRTVGEMRHTLTKYGGKLGETNSVARMFEKKSTISVEKTKIAEDTLMNAVLEAGADDYLTKPFSQRELMLRINAVLLDQVVGNRARAQARQVQIVGIAAARIGMPGHAEARFAQRGVGQRLSEIVQHDARIRRQEGIHFFQRL
mgnify:CR=1 FL=1